MIASPIFFLCLLIWMFPVSHSFIGNCPFYYVIHQDYFACETVMHARTDEIHGSEDVSDAEALLACYAYLKRRKRLGNWTQKERRQRMKAAAQPHFFWEEDLSKLAARLQKESQGERIVDDDEEHPEGERETRMRPSRTSSAAEVWSGEFTSFPTDPSPTRERRSQSAKQTWADPDFRERWYQRRWGNKVKKKDLESVEEMEIERQIRELPNGFLGSLELSSMTEEEIAGAIQTFLTKKKKQIDSRKETMGKRKAALQEQMENAISGISREQDTSSRPSRDSLFTPDEAAMKEAQQKRSERAKQLYKKRLENRKERQGRETLRSPSPKYQPLGSTPQDAMVRIQHDVARGKLPAVKDVEIIMKPGKIGKRRDILRKILSDHFDMRGKCVPTTGSDDFDFVTKCAINDLGAFVIDLIRRENRNGKDGRKP